MPSRRPPSRVISTSSIASPASRSFPIHEHPYPAKHRSRRSHIAHPAQARRARTLRAPATHRRHAHHAHARSARMGSQDIPQLPQRWPVLSHGNRPADHRLSRLRRRSRVGRPSHRSRPRHHLHQRRRNGLDRRPASPAAQAVQAKPYIRASAPCVTASTAPARRLLFRRSSASKSACRTTKVIATIHQGGGRMPSFPNIEGEHLNALVSYLRTAGASAPPEGVAGRTCRRAHAQTCSRSRRCQGLRRAVRRMPW